MNPADHHNAAVQDILQAIIKPIIIAGGGKAEILVLTESVMSGIALYCAGNDARDAQNYLDALHNRAAERLMSLERKP